LQPPTSFCRSEIPLRYPVDAVPCDEGVCTSNRGCRYQRYREIVCRFGYSSGKPPERNFQALSEHANAQRRTKD
jgi:hypothetical protein